MSTRSQIQEIIANVAGAPVAVFEYSNGGNARQWTANVPAGMTIVEAQAILAQCEIVAPWLVWSFQIDFQPRITAHVNTWR